MITSLLNVKQETVSEINIMKQEPEWKQLCKECSSAAKKAGITKADSRLLLKQIREKYNI